MATEKNPSIYYDRGTIGSSDELDEYGVWVKLEPEEVPSNILQTDEAAGTIGGELSLEDIPEPDNFDFGGFGADSEDPGSAAEPEKGPVFQTPADKTGATDLSTKLLLKIAEELSSIKSELSGLKSELSVIRSERPSLETPDSNAADSGFFDEEDDEKIALTGDELNNIIHTADFIEEAGADASEGFADDYAATEFFPPEDKSADSTPPEENFFDLSTELQDEPAAQDSGETIIYDGLGRPIKISDSPDVVSAGAEPVTGLSAGPEETETADLSESGDTQEIIYDGLGRPLNLKSSDSSDGVSVVPAPIIDLESKDSEDLKNLREEGAVPITPAPEDTSYREEVPLAPQGDELLDLTDAVIDEPDLSEGLNEPPLEEPSLDNLSLIDLDNVEDISGEPGEEPKSEENLFEEVSFDDLAEEEPLDLSAFDDAFENDEGISMDPEGEDLNFEMISENAELPVQENMQNNVITEDSFEPIDLDGGGESIDLSPGIEISEENGDFQINEDLEQALPTGMKIELDLPPLELPVNDIDEFFKESGLDDQNFSGPGAAVTADAGDPTDLTEDVPVELSDDFSMEIPTDFVMEELPAENITELPAVNPEPGTEETDGGIAAGKIPSNLKNELRNVLSYMDKLLESLPEDKIEEFAKSDYYDTYKKLFEELGIK
jgi:hypothetical protein